MSQLILIRHGETAKNVQGVLHATADAETLTEKGVGQIKKTAEKLKEFSPAKIYSSDEPRATQSGELLSNELGIPFEQVIGLHERNWGEFSGKPWAEVQKVLAPMSLEERYTYVPSGGESWQQFEARLISAINALMEVHRDETIVVVSHGGSIRALMPYLLRVPKEESFKYDPDNASLTIFERKDGALTPVAINNTLHLKE